MLNSSRGHGAGENRLASNSRLRNNGIAKRFKTTPSENEHERRGRKDRPGIAEAARVVSDSVARSVGPRKRRAPGSGCGVDTVPILSFQTRRRLEDSC